VLGSIVVEPRAGNWLRSSEDELCHLLWPEIMHTMARTILPSGWLLDSEKNVRQSKIKANNDFKAYVGRAWDLFTLVKAHTSLNLRNLAKYAVWGTPEVFQRWIAEKGLLRVANFSWLEFVASATDIWNLLQASHLLPT
jgi:hypothetical protein